jgi:phosphatidate cytidylyltransferase
MARGPIDELSTGTRRMAATVKAKAVSPWRDLLPRVASAMALGPLVLGAAYFGGLWWQGVATLIGTLCIVEWAMLNGLKHTGQPFAIATVTVPAAEVAYLVTGSPWGAVVVTLAVANGMAWWRRTFGIGVLYIGVGWLGILLLRDRPFGFENLFFLLLVVWANDIGAYAAGRLFGGRRLAPRLSPAKTWSGAGGGLVCAVVAGLCVALYFHAGQAGQFRAEGLAAVVSIFAQAGDLLESAMKRRFGRKDSGGLIPGHGGALDRVDGLFTAAPIALLWTLAWQYFDHGTTMWQ